VESKYHDRSHGQNLSLNIILFFRHLDEPMRHHDGKQVYDSISLV
jgi:hypothetical protein